LNIGGNLIEVHADPVELSGRRHHGDDRLLQQLLVGQRQRLVRRRHLTGLMAGNGGLGTLHRGFRREAGWSKGYISRRPGDHLVLVSCSLIWIRRCRPR
jgi:hypothetical protein